MNSHIPPKWATRFLHAFVAEELEEEIAGDLLEAYEHRLQNRSKWKADLLYIADVFRFFKPYSFEKYSRTKQYLPMVKNYFKIAFRNIMNRKGFTSINLIGLTLCIALILIISLFLNYHLSHDAHYPQADRTYRLENAYRSQRYAPFRFESYYNSDRLTQLKNKQWLESFSAVDQVAYLLQSDAAIGPQDDHFLDFSGDKFICDQLVFTNTAEAFLNIFPQQFLMGSAETFSRNFQQAVLTESTAERIFGENWSAQNLVGSTFIMETERLEENNYQLAGVVADPAPNSHFTFNMLTHTQRIPSWGAYTYFTTNEQVNLETLQADFNDRYAEIEPNYGQDERYKGAVLQPLTDIHLSQFDILYELRARVNPSILFIFGTVALVILCITLINYTNLSIAMYSHRQKEIGMRKVMGARGQDIILQLMVEVSLVALISFPFAGLLVYGVLPGFNELMDIQIPTDALLSFNTILIGLLIALGTGLLSGLYPSIIFSRKNLLKLFKAKINQSQGKYHFGLRRALLGVQFVLLVLMLSLTGYVYQQMDFIQSKDLGFEEKGVVSIPTQGWEEHTQAKAMLEKLPEVEKVGTGRLPGTNRFNTTTYKLKGQEEIFDDANRISADLSTMRTIGVEHPSFQQLDAGFDRVYLINRTLADQLMTTYDLDEEELIGSTIIEEPEYTDPETGEVGLARPIAGILPDMHYFSLRFQVNPLIFTVDRERGFAFNTVIRFKDGADLPIALDKVEEVYYEAGNELPFDFTFLSDQIDELYRADQRSFLLIGILSLCAILLAMIGLIGLVSYLVFTRQKEIGIRKVFGASVTQILYLMNKEFLVLMLLATLVAVPLIYSITYSWLNNFAYRIEMNPWVIAAAGLGAMLIVATVVSMQSRMSAVSNPTDVLTEE